MNVIPSKQVRQVVEFYRQESTYVALQFLDIGDLLHQASRQWFQTELQTTFKEALEGPNYRES